MAKYIATVLIDVDDDLGFIHKRSSKGSVKGLLESRILLRVQLMSLFFVMAK
jgi:hypothetical protein